MQILCRVLKVTNLNMVILTHAFNLKLLCVSLNLVITLKCHWNEIFPFGKYFILYICTSCASNVQETFDTDVKLFTPRPKELRSLLNQTLWFVFQKLCCKIQSSSFFSLCLNQNDIDGIGVSRFPAFAVKQFTFNRWKHTSIAFIALF